LNLHEKPFAELPPNISSTIVHIKNPPIIMSHPFHPRVPTMNQNCPRHDFEIELIPSHNNCVYGGSVKPMPARYSVVFAKSIFNFSVAMAKEVD
jgi:hypothetical protein